MTVGFGTTVVSLDAAVIVRTCVSFAAPDVTPVKFTVCCAASSFSVRLFIGSSVGGSLIGLIVTLKVRVVILLDAPPSFTLTVIVAVPKAFATGVKLRLPVAFGLV